MPRKKVAARIPSFPDRVWNEEQALDPDGIAVFYMGNNAVFIKNSARQLTQSGLVP